MTAVHQLIVGAGPGDAITQMAIALRSEFRASAQSDIFARFVDPAIADDVATIDHLPPGRRSDLVIYHSSYGDPVMTEALLRRPERIVLVYHNITPSEFFIDHDPVFAAGLEWGRHELELLRDRVILAVADSDFNARELEAIGYTDVHTVPAGVRPGRLTSITPSYDTLLELRETVASPFVLAVGQLLPHKRHDVLIQAIHILQFVHGVDIGLVLAGTSRLPRYQQALHELAWRLKVRSVWFTGRRSDRELATLFRSAHVFASASVHEGLGLPPLEAMTFDLPAVVRDAGATAETVGRGALVLPPDSGPLMFAEALARLTADRALRSQMIHRGSARIDELAASARPGSLVELLERSGVTL